MKKLVSESCRKLAFSQLQMLQRSHSKMSNVVYEEFKIQPYFNDESIDARTLFLFRTRMVRVQNNYQGMTKDNLCPLCKIVVDSQEHLLECEHINNTPPDVTYGDIFGEDLCKMKITLDALKSSFKIREDILKTDVVPIEVVS